MKTGGVLLICVLGKMGFGGFKNCITANSIVGRARPFDEQAEERKHTDKIVLINTARTNPFVPKY